jgi:hypothetical protein
VDRGSLLHGALTREAELEDVTDALLLSRNDDFNALAAAELRLELGHAHVFRAASDPDHGDFELPPAERGIIAAGHPSSAELERLVADGWRLVQDGEGVALFAVGPTGEVHVATTEAGPSAEPGDTVVALSRGRA